MARKKQEQNHLPCGRFGITDVLFLLLLFSFESFDSFFKLFSRRVIIVVTVVPSVCSVFSHLFKILSGALSTFYFVYTAHVAQTHTHTDTCIHTIIVRFCRLFERVCTHTHAQMLALSTVSLISWLCHRVHVDQLVILCDIAYYVGKNIGIKMQTFFYSFSVLFSDCGFWRCEFVDSVFSSSFSLSCELACVHEGKHLYSLCHFYFRSTGEKSGSR